MSAEAVLCSLVVPCYNECDNLEALVGRANEVLRAEPRLEVVLVDNGSTDDSALLLKSLVAQDQTGRLRVTSVAVNQGYGWGILSGLDSCRGEVLAWTHADLQTDLGDVLTGFALYLDDPKPFLLVKGKRKNRGFAAKFFSWGMEVYASARLGCRLTEINAQPKIFSRRFYLEHIQGHAPHDFSLDLFVQYLAQQKGSVVEFPVYFNPRLHGEAKGGGGRRTRWKLIARTRAYIDTLAKELRS